MAICRPTTFTTVRNKRQDIIFSALGVLLILLIWQLTASFGGTGFLLPGPIAVASTFIQLFTQSANWRSVAISAFRIIESVLVAILLAILLSWIASKSRAVRQILSPFVLIMKSVPIVSFILIALFFMGASMLSFFICGLIVFPIVYAQLLSSFLNTDAGLLEMARVFSLKRSEKIRYIIIPGSREVFIASVSVSVGMAWKAGVAAEVLAFSGGTIGRHMHEAKLYLDMERLLSWTLALVLVSFLSEQLLVRLFRFILTRIGQKLPVKRRGVKEVKAREELLTERDTPLACPVEGQAIMIRGVLCVKKPYDDEAVPSIVIDGISKCFGSSYVFSEYSATIPLDRPLAVIGPSGVGKTTLMRMIAGLIRPDSGVIDGVPSRGVFVFQDNRLLGQMSARDNVRLVLPGYDGERADELLLSLDLMSVKDQPAVTLSGGEKRRLSLARALAPESDILYLDEAFRELDEAHEGEALSLLLDKAGEKPVIFATHDLSLIERMNANILELRK